MCSKTASLSFSWPKQAFGLSSKCPESDEIKSKGVQGSFLFIRWPVFRPSLGQPYAAGKKEAMWGQKASSATATANGLAQMRLKWRHYLSDREGHRQREQICCTLNHRTAAHWDLLCISWGEPRWKAGRSFQTHSPKTLASPSSSTKSCAKIKPSHLAMFCPS